MMAPRPCNLAIMLLLGACASDAPTSPAAPTDLLVKPLGAGAHLTWKDNSSDELEFKIMRRPMAATTMTELARVPFDGTSFHDEPVTQGATYVYQVVATNENGDSESDQVTFVAP